MGLGDTDILTKFEHWQTFEYCDVGTLTHCGTGTFSDTQCHILTHCDTQWHSVLLCDTQWHSVLLCDTQWYTYPPPLSNLFCINTVFSYNLFSIAIVTWVTTVTQLSTQRWLNTDGTIARYCIGHRSAISTVMYCVSKYTSVMYCIGHHSVIQ